MHEIKRVVASLKIKQNTIVFLKQNQCEVASLEGHFYCRKKRVEKSKAAAVATASAVKECLD